MLAYVVGASTWKGVVGLVNNQRTCEVAVHSPAVADCLQVAIGNRAKSGGGTLAGNAAREDVRPVQRTLAPRPHGLFTLIRSVDVAMTLTLT